MKIHWKDWCWSWLSNILATWWEELTDLKIPWCWERLRVGGEVDDRGWDGWMTSRTQWTCVWVNSGSCDGPGGLACCSPWDGRVTHDWGTGLNWSKEDSRLYLCSTVRKSDSLSYLKGFSFFFLFYNFKMHFIFFIFFNFILFLKLKHCISFAKHQNESATGIQTLPFFASSLFFFLMAFTYESRLSEYSFY